MLNTKVIPLIRNENRHGARWTEDELWRVITMYAENETWPDISDRLKRSEGACKTMVAKIKWAYTTKRVMDELIYEREDEDGVSVREAAS